MKKYIPYIIFASTLSVATANATEFKLANLFKPKTENKANWKLFSTARIGSNTRVANTAERHINTHYNRGVKAQCAAFVGHVVIKSGYTPPRGYAKCTNWLSWGKRGSIATLRRGDIIIYSKSSSGYNHIGIYDGNGQIIHRPTRSAPVRKMNYRYRSILAVRRP